MKAETDELLEGAASVLLGHISKTGPSAKLEPALELIHHTVPLGAEPAHEEVVCLNDNDTYQRTIRGVTIQQHDTRGQGIVLKP